MRWDAGRSTSHYGFGVRAGQLHYHVNNVDASHAFYPGGKNGDDTELLRISGTDNSTDSIGDVNRDCCFTIYKP